MGTTREIIFREQQRGHRALATPPATVDLEARTVEVVWSTGALVQRYSWAEDVVFEEELVLEGARLDRFQAGAPFLNQHRTYDLDNVFGRTVPNTTRLEGGQGISLVKFSERQRAMEHLRDIRDGVSPEVSIGYWIYRVERVDRTAENKVPLWRVLDWEPFEISGVVIAADQGAGYRDQQQHGQRSLANQEPTTMPEKNDKTPSAAEPTDTTTTDQRAAVEAAKAQARAEERERQQAIRDVGAKLRISSERVDSLLADGTSLADARAKMIDWHAEEEEPKSRVLPDVQITRDQKRSDSLGMVGAILHRAAPGKHPLDDNSRRFAHGSLVDYARMSLEARGINTRGMSKGRIAERALGDDQPRTLEMQRDGALGHTSGDFALILADVQNKQMQRGYTEYASNWKVFCNQGNAQDFKLINTYQLSEAPDFEVVNEAGEYQFGQLEESKESYRVVKTGKRCGVTFEMIVNDDMSAFTRIPFLFGQAGARREADVVWGIFTGNPAMGDGTVLFHADHGSNLATGGDVGAPDIDGITWAMNTMGLQRGPKNKAELNLQLAVVAVPFAQRLTAAQLKASIVAAKTTDAVPDEYKGFQLIVEPRLQRNSSTAWYGIADKNQIDTIEYAYLAGYEGVTMEERVRFSSDGVEMKFRHIFGAKAKDWRAFVKNPGA